MAVREPEPTGSLIEAVKPGKPVPVRAWTPLLLASILVAGAIIAVVVYLTPKPVDDPALVEQLKAELKIDTQPKPGPPPLAPATLVLPREPQQIEDARLFELLEQLADQAVERLPEDPAALHIAALIHSELKQTAAAEELWKRCLSKRPKQPGPFLAFADLLVKLGRAEEAAKLLEDNWAQLAAWPEAAQMRARVLDQLGEPEAAIQLLESSLRANPRYVDNWLELGQLQNQLRQYAEAESSLRTAVGLGMSANETLLFALSTAVARQNRPEEAKKLLDVFQELKQTNADPSGNRFQEAYSVALRRIATRALMNAAAMYNETGHLEWAEPTVMQLLKLDPEHVSGLMTLSSILRKQNRLADALLVHQRIREREPDNPLNTINLASVMLEMGAVPEAEGLLKSAAEKEPPESGFLHAELARVYINLKRYSDARAYAREAVNRQPVRQYYTLLATACKELNDRGGLFEALSAIEQIERGTKATQDPAHAPQ